MNRLLLGLFGIAAAASAAGCRDRSASAAGAPPPPPTVSVVTVAPERIAMTGEWIGTLDGIVNAQIRPQVSGYLLRRAYREGAHVRKGEVLFEIDRRPLEATLSQAKARLAEAKAQLAKSERDLSRDRPLAEQRAIAQSQLDNDLSARDAAQAAQASADAAVESAELNLRFTRVTSLVDGIAAFASAQIGDLVGPTTLLTTVSQVDPITVYFPIGEQEYLAIADAVRSPAALARLWQDDGGLALILVVLVVYLFLQNWRATLIPVIAVPVSLIGTFIVFPAMLTTGPDTSSIALMVASRGARPFSMWCSTASTTTMASSAASRAASTSSSP
ncbi:MAG: efflux RND transporter periplasmic adaptor subunit [Vicinamibacteraceae bacterium]